MAIYYGLNDYTPDERGSCVALGFFDGVHIGHRAVIGGCGGGGLRKLALTFGESPVKALTGEMPPQLTDNGTKARLLSCAGADDVIFADFLSLKDKSAEEFVREILSEKLNAKTVCCGFNYRFGRGGEGDTETLKRLCGELGIEVRVCLPVTLDGEQVSSSRIRELISLGEIKRANEMLGYRFAIAEDIGSGNHIGSTMGFPTVNIPLSEDIVVPRYGVYASVVTVGGARYIGATNIGVHPTAGENDKPLCESFLLDFRGESLYGKTAVCEIEEFIREEKRFDSLDELRRQIDKDCRRIVDIVGTINK